VKVDREGLLVDWEELVVEGRSDGGQGRYHGGQGRLGGGQGGGWWLTVDREDHIVDWEGLDGGRERCKFICLLSTVLHSTEYHNAVHNIMILFWKYLVNIRNEARLNLF
jgi:hypothetical protein